MRAVQFCVRVILATTVFTPAARAQTIDSLKAMAKRAAEGAKSSKGNIGDKVIEGTINAVTPQADEQTRQVQRNAVKYLVDPSPKRANEHYSAMIAPITGSASGTGSTGSNAALTPADASVIKVMKADLRNLVTSEEAYFSVQRQYTPTVTNLRWRPSAGVSIVSIRVAANSWSAVASYAGSSRRCSIAVNVPSGDPTPEGTPVCQ